MSTEMFRIAVELRAELAEAQELIAKLRLEVRQLREREQGLLCP